MHLFHRSVLRPKLHLVSSGGARFTDRHHPARPAPCAPRALAALGPLLCLHRADEEHALRGWTQAESVRASICVDSDGPHEGLLFYDGKQRICWQLYLLPDSDYLAWDRMLETIEHRGRPEPRRWPMAGAFGIERIIGNPVWRACALRLHAVPGYGSQLAVGDAVLSDVGRRALARLLGYKEQRVRLRPDKSGVSEKL